MLRIGPKIQPALASALVLVAVARAAFFDDLAQRMDDTFFVLLAAAALIVVVPWERLASRKAGGLEVTLEAPQVVGALRALGLERVQDEQLQHELVRLEPELGDCATVGCFGSMTSPTRWWRFADFSGPSASRSRWHCRPRRRSAIRS